MKRLTIVIFLVTISSLGYGGVPKASPRSRIMGGHSVDIVDYPYQVLLMRQGINYCGGSLIRDDYVLTAAHCVYDGSPGEFSVRAGSSIVSEGGIVTEVIDIHYHRNFSETTYENDVAVLKLGQKFPIISRIQTIDLPEKNEPLPFGKVGAVTGWGRLSATGAVPHRLQEVDLPVQPESFCEEKLGPDTLDAGMFCAGYSAGGKDTCQGDSGGPLVVDKKQYGITSWGDDCGTTSKPGVYTNVAYFRDFIEQALIEI